MLAADKQLLDAHLRNELQQLRRLEITNVVNRFQNALTPATLIAGFSFTSIVELEFTNTHPNRSSIALHAEPLFYIGAAAALSLSLYVTAVSSVGIVFGQRLTIQATASQGNQHDATVRELNDKFFWVLVALGGSMCAVVMAATCVIWVKDPSEDSAGNHAGWLSVLVTVIVGLLAIATVLSMLQMFVRLHTPTPEASGLTLRTGKGKSLADVPEFFVAGDPPSMSGGNGGYSSTSSSSAAALAAAARKKGPAPDERSGLLCLERPGKGPH